MTNKALLDDLRVIFSSARSPGEAFDAILRLRKADVTFDTIVTAIREQGGDSLDTVATGAPKADVLYFGKYRGKPLAEVALRDPKYLKWAIENATCISDEWRVKMEKALEEQGESLDDDDDDETCIDRI